MTKKKKLFNVDYKNMICPTCLHRIYIHDIFPTLYRSYKKSGVNGYGVTLHGSCKKCQDRYNIACDCHEYNNRITVVPNKIEGEIHV